jgi:hypothetical protein
VPEQYIHACAPCRGSAVTPCMKPTCMQGTYSMAAPTLSTPLNMGCGPCPLARLSSRVTSSHTVSAFHPCCSLTG